MLLLEDVAKKPVAQNLTCLEPISLLHFLTGTRKVVKSSPAVSEF